MNRPATGTVVRVKQLGTGGYEFVHPCFALVSPDTARLPAQCHLRLISMDLRDYRRMEKGYSMRTRDQAMVGFSSPPENLEPGGDDGDVALAQWALMGSVLFVKGDNNG